MRLFLNAGFGEPVGRELLEQLHRMGYHGIRQDILKPEDAPGLCAEISDAGCDAILLVAGHKMDARTGTALTPDQVADTVAATATAARHAGLLATRGRVAFEIGNEPDIGRHYDTRPELFAEAVRRGAEAVRSIAPDAVVISGGVTTTDRGGLDYLRRAVAAGLPGDIAMGYHAYRTTVTPETALRGFASRDAEFAELRAIAGQRELWCTEVGWHTSVSKVRYFLDLLTKRVQFTDAQVADFADRELRIHHRHGAQAVTWFQLNDGSGTHYEDSFGIRDLTGNWKPVADRAAQTVALLEKPPAATA